MTIAKMELDGSIRLGKEEWIKIEYIVAGKIPSDVIKFVINLFRAKI